MVSFCIAVWVNCLLSFSFFLVYVTTKTSVIGNMRVLKHGLIRTHSDEQLIFSVIKIENHGYLSDAQILLRH